MISTDQIWAIFNTAIEDYHKTDSVDAEMQSEFPQDSLEHLLYKKNWIDTVQWHLEDIIRDEEISPENALLIKRRIDKSNQIRTDLVEFIDDYFLHKFSGISPKPSARLNTETAAWALDRLSILALKVYHMRQEAERAGASEEHRVNCNTKLQTLLLQKNDLCTAIQTLLNDIQNGDVQVKIYRQMKMYNDENLNPVLYKKK